MFLIFLDTEATGLDWKKHSLMEIAFKIISKQDGKVCSSYSSIVKLSPSSLETADLESLAVTKLTTEIISSQGKEKEVVLNEILEIFNNYNINKFNSIFVCQNPSMDRLFFTQLVSPRIQKQNNWPYHWLDLASMFWALKCAKEDKKNDFEVLSKDNIAKHLGLEKEPSPHRALQGVEHLILCYEQLIGKIGSINYS